MIILSLFLTDWSQGHYGYCGWGQVSSNAGCEDGFFLLVKSAAALRSLCSQLCLREHNLLARGSGCGKMHPLKKFQEDVWAEIQCQGWELIGLDSGFDEIFSAFERMGSTAELCNLLLTRSCRLECRWQAPMFGLIHSFVFLSLSWSEPASFFDCQVTRV